ncbi:hypothetical protein E3N88_27484 [Mikania micrantha]|uniref:GED domain-containing protein n=1 Tax=Mikania micrantha TaxID=192012 RepID=A0A5N6MWS2_9ASTR|nr:hypothetical protein E3N88_27484 [Mikania micrantha]
MVCLVAALACTPDRLVAGGCARCTHLAPALNEINDETYEEARNQEATLFETHPLLSKIDKSMKGIPVLSHRLVEIQSVIISKCLPNIIKKINERLHASVLDFNKLPRNLTSVSEAMGAFVQIVGSFKETLQKILIRGELEEYEDDKQMHCSARLAEMVDKLSQDLQSSVKFSKNFLVEEMQILEEANGIRLPHFLPHLVFSRLLKRRVNGVSDLPVCFVNKFMEGVDEMIEMEKMTDYTCDPEFIPSYDKLMGNHDLFLNSLNCLYISSQTLNMEGYSINVNHLNDVSANIRNQAFDLKMRMTTYWKIVLKRMLDYLALQLRFFMQQLVNKDIEVEIMSEVMVNGGGIEKMLVEPPYVAKKRERLQSSISLLKESKEIIEQVMDGIVVTSD